MAAREVSVHIRRQRPLVGWIAATKRTSRAPQHVADLILDDHPTLAVDGTVGLLESLGNIQQRPALDLAAIDPGPASLARVALLVSGVGDGVGLHPGVTR
jgi:hypothetical protein